MVPFWRSVHRAKCALFRWHPALLKTWAEHCMCTGKLLPRHLYRELEIPGEFSITVLFLPFVVRWHACMICLSNPNVSANFGLKIDKTCLESHFKLVKHFWILLNSKISFWHNNMARLQLVIAVLASSLLNTPRQLRSSTSHPAFCF